MYKRRVILFQLLEVARTEANVNYEKADEDQMKCLDTLAAYYVQEANKEKKSEKKRELFTKATFLYTTADNIHAQCFTSRIYCTLRNV